MHLDDGVPLGFGHVGEHPVTEDAGVVDHDVEFAEVFDRLVHHALGTLPAGDVVAVDDGLAAHAFDLGNDVLGWGGVVARSVDLTSEVVDHHLRSLAGELDSVASSDPSAGTGDDDHLPVADSHDRDPLRLLSLVALSLVALSL